MEFISGFSGAVVWSGLVLCALCLFIVLYVIGDMFVPNGLDWKKQRHFQFARTGYRTMESIFRIYRGNDVTDYDRLFQAAGWRRWRGNIYVLSKRLCISALFVVCLCTIPDPRLFQITGLLFVVVILVGFMDKKILDSMRKRRERLMFEEMYAISHQLLYLSDSKMNLHGKLTRCLPHANVLRQDLILLLHEWYEDVDQAFENFRKRLGTSEGYSFAETLNAIRQFDSDFYYELLRQRIDDYKMTLEMHRDSQRETLSYALFVLAGIPILNTFRIFIYPWVEEGQRLMDMLH